MASSVYSIPFAGTILTAPITQDVATVPPGYVWVLRELGMRADNGSNISSLLVQWVNFPIVGPIFAQAVLAAGEFVQYQGRQVATAGATLRIQVGGSGNFRFYASGYQLAA